MALAECYKSAHEAQWSDKGESDRKQHLLFPTWQQAGGQVAEIFHAEKQSEK